MDLDSEPQNARDARVEELWKKLDTRKQGYLDLDGLKKGLTEIDHPLRNANGLLADMLKTVDTNGDGKIDYSEFLYFVEHTENELWQLFKSIDRDHNGQLDKDELHMALIAAGLIVPRDRLDQFFSEIDANHDGSISFEEWRNFLLFVPTHEVGLKAVVSYYQATVSINAEGDVHVSDDKAEGLGRPTFPKIYDARSIVTTPPQFRKLAHPASTTFNEPIAQKVTVEMQPRTFPWDPGDIPSGSVKNLQSPALLHNPIQLPEISLLTELLPDPGYFLAGGIAGVVSRTATAPLDRLKVYLIAQTGTASEAVQAVKSGAPVQATKLATRPLVNAMRSIWRLGGIQSLFAGNGLNVIKVMPESAIKFGSYEGSKRMLAKFEGHDDPKKLKPWSQFCAAGFGGIISQFFVYPLDTLKFRMQCETVQGGPHGNALIIATARKMWASTGVRSFYRGLPMGLVGMFPYSAIDLTTFEYLKRAITKRNARTRHCAEEEALPGNFMTATVGAFSGAFGASVVYPINLLRTRLQSQGTAIHPPTYTGIWDVTIRTVQGEGYRGLFKGITPNLLKVVPAVSITYVVYDNSKKILGLR
ncbi:MAG: hypothetical protein MMC33_003873 [Icmadophila ericetorum]|nr:hypothetical protein [Icmadophila ericetorum]